MAPAMNTSPYHRLWRAALALTATLPLCIAALIVPLLDSYLPFDSASLTTLSTAMVVSGLIAWVLGYAGLTLSQRVAGAGLWAQITIPVVAGAGTAIAGAIVTVRMMLVTNQEVMLLAMLLVFAALISLPVAWWTAQAIADRIGAVGQAASAMSDGNLSTRATVNGKDEVGQLAATFNSMAEQLEQAQAHQAAIEQSRKEMLVAISHDLRTPLSSIRAMGEAILDDVVDQRTGRQYVGQILSETDRLSVLINDLFELSQIDVGNLQLRLEPGDIRDSLSDTINAMQGQATRKGITLDGRFPDAISPVMVDSGRIQRVLANLVENALAHTDSGGTIRLAVEQKGNRAVVSVTDTGVGIKQEELPRIFESFYRVDQSRSDGGAGLGLTIARGIVEGHGGAIWAESTPGTGTTVWFTIPSNEHASRVRINGEDN